MKFNLLEIIHSTKNYFALLESKEDEQEVREQVESGVTFRGPQLWILMFAILIASLGLNVNSTAVIIGAMLISPLMGPIIGMGFSVGVHDYSLLTRSLKNYGVATGISIVTATLYFLLSPLSEAQSELLARTSPTLYDVLIAFCGGAAGVLALTTKGKGQVIPGVAIATALMPPLCTAGYGLATAHWSYFLGAFYLFFINTVFIALSTFLGVKLLKFKTKQELTPERHRYAQRVIFSIVFITLIPAAVLTWNIVRDNASQRNIQAFVRTELQQPGTQILSAHIEADTLQVVAVGRSISEAEVHDARRRMGYYGLSGKALNVIQGTNSEGLENLAQQLDSRASTSDQRNRELSEEVGRLQAELEKYTSLELLASAVSSEAAVLFPKVQEVGFGIVSKPEGESLIAYVRQHEAQPFTPTERDRIEAWLRTRTSDPNLLILFD